MDDARAARAECCYALSRDALAAFIELIEQPAARFDSAQALEHRALVAGSLWAAAILNPDPVPTVLPVQPASAMPPGVPVVDPLDPSTFPQGFRRIS